VAAPIAKDVIGAYLAEQAQSSHPSPSTTTTTTKS
jgi:hypothetical protein